MNSIGTINTSYIVEYKEKCENYENLDNKYIIKVKSSSLDDVIILFKEPNFKRFIHEAFNCFIVCVEFDSNEEEEDDDECTAIRLEGTFKADRLIILQLNGNLWIKKCLQKKFFNMKSPKMRKYHKLLEDINYVGDFLCSQLRLQDAIDWIKSAIEDFEIKIIKLFKFENQKEVDKKLFDKAFKQKCSFDVIQSMISFHKNTDATSSGMIKYEVDALLWSKGITVFDEEIIENFKQELRIEDKEKITDEIEKFHGNQKSLLQHLCSRSRIALYTEDTGDEKLQMIEGYYRTLIDLNLDSVADLLKIVDHKLNIVFDFDSSSIERSYLMGSRHNRGIFDQDRVKIYIGAKNSHEQSSQDYIIREWEIIGILIHEICHYVNFKVFNNNCKPYHKDNKNIKEYEEIVNEYKNWTDNHEIVGRVFSDYEETMWHAELIVRVIQMIVTYKVLKPENLAKFEEKYQKLFLHFNKTILPQIKKYLDPDNQLKRQIKEISSFRLNKIELKPIMKQLNYDEEKFIHFVETNSPKLAMANLFQNFAENFVIFTTFKELTDEIKVNNILQLWCSDWRIKIVIYVDQIDETSKQFDDCIKKLDNQDRLNQIFIIFKEQTENLAKFKEMFTKNVEILEKLNFGFTDLTEESKEMVLQKNVIFQGSQTALNNIITKDLNAVKFFPINHFLESPEPIVIGKLPEKNADYDEKMFIQRKLTNKIGEQVVEFSTDKMDEILQLLSTKKYIIISDEVGMGKSTLMTHLAYQFLHSTLPHINGRFFVVKINLHQHVTRLENYNNDTNLDRFIFDNFVKSSDLKEFEWKVFEEFYQKGSLILMLDGFDEIASSDITRRAVTSNCERYLLQIIQNFINSTTSNIIVATRPMYAQYLSTNMSYTLNLEFLSIQDQLNHLTTLLMSHEKTRKHYSESDVNDLCIKLLHRMLTSVTENFDSKGQYERTMLSFPLHLRMFGEVIVNKIIENNFEIDQISCFNIFDLYDDFFKIKVKIAQEDKGKIVKGEIRSLEHEEFETLQLRDCAKKLAWNTLHPFFGTNPLKISDKEKKFMQRYGLVTIENNEVYFVHRSYAEFLIAFSFFKELMKGTLLTTNFAKNHFFIDILTLMDYENIKGFIDTALSDESIHQDISIESFQNLGKFIIKEFNELQGNDKNFLHCMIEHSKNYSFKKGTIKDYVFISHCILTSLMFCDSEDDVTSIKNILEISWDENCVYNSQSCTVPFSSGITIQMNSKTQAEKSQRNLFHLVCELGINCLISAVWKLAEKIYGQNAKDYFFNQILNNRKETFTIFNVSLHLDLYCTEIDPFKVNIRRCTEIEELRKLSFIREDKNIDLNKDCNFHLSSIFLLIQLLKKLNLDEGKLIELCPEVSNCINFYTPQNVFVNFNFYLNFISTFFSSDNSNGASKIKIKICYITANYLMDLCDNIEQNMKELFDFLKIKLSENYKIFIGQLFGVAFQHYGVTLDLKRFLSEDKAKTLYLELKQVVSTEDVHQFFKYYPSFFDMHLRKKDYYINAFRHDLDLYFKVLDQDHLILLLLNESFENLNILNHVIFMSQIGCLEYLLNLLETRFTDKEKLYYVIEKSSILKSSMVDKDKLSKVFEFCERNFEKSKIVSLLFN